jgi:hypothetical protein
MPRILLVDDDDDIRTLLEHVLVAERYEVDAAGTVEPRPLLRFALLGSLPGSCLMSMIGRRNLQYEC